MTTSTLGALVQEFFLSHLVEQKGLRQRSRNSYRDTLRLFLQFAAADAHRQVSKLTPDDLSFERVLAFLRHLEQQRRNGIATRNQRLGALHTFFEFVARRDPDRLRECQQIAAIPVKRSAQPTMHSFTREEVQQFSPDSPATASLRCATAHCCCFSTIPALACRRSPTCGSNSSPWIVQRMCVCTGRANRRSVGVRPQVSCGAFIEAYRVRDPQGHVFRAATGKPLTRFGLYKRVRRLTTNLTGRNSTARNAHISPHVFRRTAAVHLLEAGVDVNVIRGWLGHANLSTTNRYAEITIRMKAEAIQM